MSDRLQHFENAVYDPLNLMLAPVSRLESFKNLGFNDIARPSLDIWNTKDGMAVQVELPGLKKDDVDVALDNNVLTIQGKLPAYKCVCDTCACTHNERCTGHFVRKVRVPEGLNADDIKADMAHGLLKLSIPKHGNEHAAVKVTIN